MATLNNKDKELIKKAKELLKNRKSKFSSTASVLISNKGNIYQGINLGVENPSAVCAEPIAVGEMMTNGEKKIDTIIATQKTGVVSPCGVCRQLLYSLEIGNPWVIINNKEKIKLNDLLPKAFN
jgi:cytidine deaminase